MLSRARRAARSFFARVQCVRTIPLFLIGAARCNAGSQATSDSAAALISNATRLGKFANRELAEASGLVSSSREPGVFWANNDSGNDERLFAFDSSGAALGAVQIPGVKNRDWEALALGPCPSGSCIYVGDVGDNLSRHNTVRVIRIAEPLTSDRVSAPPQTMKVQYPDGAKDVESIWVTPDTSVYFLTKRHDADGNGGFRAVRLYRVTADGWNATGTVTADFIDSLPISPTSRNTNSWLTDAALSMPDSSGRRFLAIRSYAEVFVFGVDSLTWQPTRRIAHCSLAPLKQGSRGEGVTWLADGRLLFHAEGEGARLVAGRCP